MSPCYCNVEQIKLALYTVYMYVQLVTQKCVMGKVARRK